MAFINQPIRALVIGVPEHQKVLRYLEQELPFLMSNYFGRVAPTSQMSVQVLTVSSMAGLAPHQQALVILALPKEVMPQSPPELEEVAGSLAMKIKKLLSRYDGADLDAVLILDQAGIAATI